MSQTIVYVVLAAGSARRMGFAKATTPLAGASPIERIAATLATLATLGGEPRPATVVTSAAQEAACALAFPDSTILVNPTPERGMTSSLAIADAAIERAATLGVLLADKPFVAAATLHRCETVLAAAETYDVLYAAVDEEPGHPVYFAPAARAFISIAPDGDTLRAVREDPGLRRRAVACDDPGVLIDLDTPEAWTAAERRLRAAGSNAT